MCVRHLNARTTRCRSVCHCLSELWVVAARARGAEPGQPDHAARKVGLEARKVRRSPPVGARKKPPTKRIPLYCASQKSPAFATPITCGCGCERAQLYLSSLMKLATGEPCDPDRTARERLRDPSHRGHLTVFSCEPRAILTQR